MSTKERGRIPAGVAVDDAGGGGDRPESMYRGRCHGRWHVAGGSVRCPSLAEVEGDDGVMYCLDCVPPARNPSDEPRTPRADGLYRRFQQLEPRFTDIVDMRIPRFAYDVGPAIHVLYRSSKRDPATLAKPRKPRDYIHDHDEGVRVYRCDTTTGKRIPVPKWIHELDDGQHDGLALLGDCQGFAYEDTHGEKVEARVSRPYPKLFAHPNGNCLFVIDYQEQKVLAMIWGGSLRVESRGIVG